MKICKTNFSNIINPYTEREVKYAFHDVDGTYSLIRNWPPVMSAVLHDVIVNGLPKNLLSDKNINRLVYKSGLTPLPETDRFCVESAGLSALTQMEWAIRRAIEEGKILINCDKELNSWKIREIWKGKELFEQRDSDDLTELLTKSTPKLFKLYEKVLNLFCRDKNLAEAKESPDKYLVKGSMRFMDFLSKNGVKNYFVTGAVVEKDKGMYEEVEGLGFQIGKGKQVEALVGSTWDEKLPKEIIMKKLITDLGCRGDEIIVVGDGRAEISAGVEMGAFTIGRLPNTAIRQKEILKDIGVNIIVKDFDNDDMYKIFNK